MTSSPLDRRTFVKASAVTAAGAWLASTSRAQSGASGTKLDPIKVGIVGCGGRGTGAIADALTADAGVELVAAGDCLADRVESCLKYFAQDKVLGPRVKVDKEHTFVGFDALEKVLATDIDVILLCTPPHWRPAQIQASLAAGKHVFAEKPFAVDAPGVRSVMESAKLAKEKGKSLVSGFCWRSSGPERETYQRIHDGAIGAIRTVYATYNAGPNAFIARTPAMSDIEWQIRNWYHYLWLGGDHIVEQACHSVDKINWAFQNEPPAKCTAVGGRAQRSKEHPGNIYDHFGVTYEWADGRRAFLQTRQWENCTNDNSDWVYGEKGVAFINGWTPYHEIKGETPWIHDGEPSSPNMYVQEHVELFRGIREGKPRFDAEWAANSTLMAIMGRMAAYTGQEVTWKMALESQEKHGPASYTMGEYAVSDVPRPGYTKFA